MNKEHKNLITMTLNEDDRHALYDMIEEYRYRWASMISPSLFKLKRLLDLKDLKIIVTAKNIDVDEE